MSFYAGLLVGGVAAMSLMFIYLLITSKRDENGLNNEPTTQDLNTLNP